LKNLFHIFADELINSKPFLAKLITKIRLFPKIKL